jgi:hypothetical protein
MRMKSKQRRRDSLRGERAEATNSPAEPPQLADGSPFSVIPGPGLRLVRRWARLSTGSRFVIAIALSALALPAAFPLVQDVSKWWLILPTVLIWETSIGCLFIPWERISGMWRVRREVWLRRATESPDGWIVVLDGRERRARSVEVFCSESAILSEGGRAYRSSVPIWTVALLLDVDPYEIDRTPAGRSAKALARVLAYEIHGDASRVREPHVGPDAWRPEYLSAGDSAFAPLTVRWCSLVIPLATSDPRFILVGVFAIALRVAIVVERLANATARQLDPKHFAKNFRGARPARPIRGLDPKRAKRAVFWARVLMYCAAASIMVQVMIFAAQHGRR